MPLVLKAKAMVEERGPIIQCVSTFYKDYRGGSPYYNGAIDILHCDAIHAVDMLRFMGGEVDEVASDVQARAGARYDNMFNALVKFEGDAVGVLLTNWNVGSRVHTFEMHAEGISAYVNPDDRALIFADNASEPQVVTTQEAAGSDEARVYLGFRDENRHFIDCVKSGAQPQTHLRDAAESMDLVDWIFDEAW